MDYSEFVSEKLGGWEPCGIDPLSTSYLFDFQDALVKWSLRLGKSAIFADTGLGKTRMQLAWADQVSRFGPVLILAPLAVARQTVAEGVSVGVEVVHLQDQPETLPSISITNYDRIHKFDCSQFSGVVLDESSIIKHHDSRTFTNLTKSFRNCDYKLCATATPSPNDWTELGTHAEFLGVCSRAEMLSEFFIHDAAKTQDWRLKGHAQQLFWRWVATWGALVRNPSDIGFDGSRYELPPLTIEQHTVYSGQEAPQGMLFAMEAQTLSERRDARRSSVEDRIKSCAQIVGATPGPWVVWCELNTESELLTQSIDGAVEVTGAEKAESKESKLLGFADGEFRVLVTKPKIAGFGLNWQHCSNMAFVGVTDSFESYYQAVRRCWRFGQKSQVNVHIFASELEGAVVANLARKDSDYRVMAESLSAMTAESVKRQVFGLEKTTNEYNANNPVSIPTWMERTA